MRNSEKFWDKLAKNYDHPDKIAAINEYQSIQSLKKYLNNTDLVLDLGCATGTICCFLAGDVKEIHGIDISARMIRIAQKRAAERGLDNTNFSQSTIYSENFRKNSINMVLAFSVMHLVPHAEKIMQRIYELLRPGGYFVSLTPCLREKAILSALIFLGKKAGILPNITCFTIKELEKLITKDNFQLIENKCIDNNPLEYFIMAKKI